MSEGDRVASADDRREGFVYRDRAPQRRARAAHAASRAREPGIVFVRTDLGEPVEIPARSAEVASTALATTLGRGDATVGTVEHLLAALYGLGIDNVRIEVDGPELPVMDGSAAPFVYLIRSAGIFQQREARRCCASGADRGRRRRPLRSASSPRATSASATRSTSSTRRSAARSSSSARCRRSASSATSPRRAPSASCARCTRSGTPASRAAARSRTPSCSTTSGW